MRTNISVRPAGSAQPKLLEVAVITSSARNGDAVARQRTATSTSPASGSTGSSRWTSFRKGLLTLNVRGRLKGLLILRDRQEKLKEDLERLQVMSTGLKAIRYDKDKVQNFDISDLSEAIAEMDEIERKLIMVHLELAREMYDVTTMLRTLRNKGEFDVLYERYVRGRSVNDIADDFNGKQVTPEWIRILMARGIRNLEKNFK